MAYEQQPTKDHGLARASAKPNIKDTHGSLKDAHGKGISAESTYDLMGHSAEPNKNEAMLGSQGGPQPSGGEPGMRAQLGSFEAGQTDTGGGFPGQDVEPRSPHPFGLDPDLPNKMKKRPDSKK